MTIETLDNVHIIDLYGCHCCWIKNSRAVAVSISHANPPRKKLSCSLPPFIFRFFLFLSLSISFSLFFLSLSFFLFLPFSLTCCPPLPFFTVSLSLSFLIHFWIVFQLSDCVLLLALNLSIELIKTILGILCSFGDFWF